jgi:hypothetical protein
MVIPNAVAYGVLVSVGLLILLAFFVVFMRVEGAPKRIKENRPPMPLGWPTSTPAASATSPVKPVGLRALWRRSHRS